MPPRALMRKDTTHTTRASANRGNVEGSGTEVTENVAGFGSFAEESCT